MKLIYNNFDTFDVSFQGALPEQILNQLAQAREKSQNEKREIPIEIGTDGLLVMVAETGARGGYRYRFDTGIDGETWFIAHSTNARNWNIRVSVKSLSLALNGYQAVKQKILERLIAFEAVGQSAYPEHISDNQKRLYLPTERISRFDYCFDFIMDDGFDPDPRHFIAHQRTKKHVYGEQGRIQNYSALQGKNIDTVRVGSMPGRQAVLYNKTKEIQSSSKRYMWDIWGLDVKAFKESSRNIWRLEVRAGKEELNKWGLKRFKDFEDKAGDVITDILKAIRYTTPLKDDLNRSRWPIAPIWQSAIDNSYKALSPYSTNAIRENVIRDYRENVVNGYRERLIGNAIGMTAAQGRDISELTIVLDELQQNINSIAKEDINALVKKFEKAEERFRYLM